MLDLLTVTVIWVIPAIAEVRRDLGDPAQSIEPATIALEQFAE
jgi:hypothetical protein